MDPTTFFSDFKDAKINFLLFSYNLPTGTLSSVLKKFNFLQKFCATIFLKYFIFYGLIGTVCTVPCLCTGTGMAAIGH
jgi:hypothetical protein